MRDSIDFVDNMFETITCKEDNCILSVKSTSMEKKI